MSEPDRAKVNFHPLVSRESGEEPHASAAQACPARSPDGGARGCCCCPSPMREGEGKGFEGLIVLLIDGLIRSFTLDFSSHLIGQQPGAPLLSPAAGGLHHYARQQQL